MKREHLALMFEASRLTGAGAEIGVYKGEFAKELLSVYKGEIYLVDPWAGDYVGLPKQDWDQVVKELNKNIGSFNNAHLRRGLSVDMAKYFSDGALDFVYIDADHTYEHITEDISLWYPKLRVGGYLCGHDYLAEGYPRDPEQGVNRAVDEFIAASGFDLMLTDEPKWKSFCIVKER